MIVCSGFASSSSSLSFVDQLVQQRAQRLDVDLRVHLRAAELARRRRAARSRAAARAAAPPAARSRARPRGSRPDLQVLRDRAVRLLAARRLGELDQAGAVEHAHVEVEVAGVDGRAAAASSRFVSGSRTRPSACSTFRRSGCPSAFSCSGRSSSRTSSARGCGSRACSRLSSSWPLRPRRGRPRPEPVPAGSGWRARPR